MYYSEMRINNEDRCEEHISRKWFQVTIPV